MLVIVLESAPPRLRGYLSRLFIELRAGVFVGAYSVRVREKVWEVVKQEIDEGNAVIAWAAPNDAGFDFDTCGVNRRIPVMLDGLKLCSFTPPPEIQFSGKIFENDIKY